MKAWSYSSLTAYETCPRRYYLTRVSKEVVEPESEQMRWGNLVHKALELRIKDKTPLPEGMKKYEKLVSAVEAKPGEIKAEMQICLNASFNETEWLAKDAWCRGIIDVHVVDGDKALALDWKTGKPKADNDQLKLFAGLMFHVYPELTRVKTGFVWLAHGKVTKDVFTREQLPVIWGSFLPRVKRLERAYDEDKWLPKPSGLCKKWCPVGRSLCEFCGL